MRNLFLIVLIFVGALSCRSNNTEIIIGSDYDSDINEAFTYCILHLELIDKIQFIKEIARNPEKIDSIIVQSKFYNKDYKYIYDKSLLKSINEYNFDKIDLNSTMAYSCDRCKDINKLQLVHILGYSLGENQGGITFWFFHSSGQWFFMSLELANPVEFENEED
jgi:hypothetical protein